MSFPLAIVVLFFNNIFTILRTCRHEFGVFLALVITMPNVSTEVILTALSGMSLVTVFGFFSHVLLLTIILSSPELRCSTSNSFVVSLGFTG